MERLITLCLLLPACLTAAPKLSETPAVAVFEAKKNIPHASVRIPALLMTSKGTLIAIAEARDKATDQAGNDLLVALATFLVWSFAEVRRLGMRRWWVYPILTFGIAFAFAFPLFLFLRDRRLQERDHSHTLL